MGSAATVVTRLRTALVLGRVSNLPTVLSNALAGAAASGGALAAVGAPAFGLTLFYVGGMYLNDAFDAPIDARERPTRPIPSGAASRPVVFAAGFLMLAAGLALALTSLVTAATGALLAACIVLYDAAHKGISVAPLIMGACRVLCYVFAAAATGGDVGAPPLALGAAGLFLHIVGLTYAARQEGYDRIEAISPLAALAGAVVIALYLSRGSLLALFCAFALAGTVALALRLLLRRQQMGDSSRAVGLLIAATSLYDAALIAGCGVPAWPL